MIQLNSIFNLEALTIYPERDHLLIVTSRECVWCQKLKPYWRELEQELKEQYTVYGLEVNDVGGPRVFMEGVWFFLEKGLAPRLGYPSFYHINVSKKQMDLVPTSIYWKTEEQEFSKEGLLDHLQEAVK